MTDTPTSDADRTGGGTVNRRHLLLVGAGPGLGTAVARRFAVGGYRVTLVARNLDRLDHLANALSDTGAKIGTIEADAGDSESLGAGMAQLYRGEGAPGVIIYNAVMGAPDQLLSASVAHLQAAYAVDVISAIVVAQVAAPAMRATGFGTIIVTTGGGFADQPIPALATVSLGKAALRSAATMLAADVAPDGIRVATLTIAGLIVAGPPLTRTGLLSTTGMLSTPTAHGSRSFALPASKRSTRTCTSPRALEWLLYSSVLAVASRPGFERVYDLSERVIPPGVAGGPVRVWMRRSGWRPRRWASAMPGSLVCGRTADLAFGRLVLVGGVNAEWLDSRRHDLSGFSCGDPSVDGWLRTSVESEVAGARTRVAVVGRRVLGCYRLGAFQVGTQSGQPWGAEGEPVSPVLGVLISRLGVDVGWQGRGLGSAFLGDAVVVAERVSAATDAQLLVVKADAEWGDGFFARFGFRPVGSVARWRYLTVRDVQATLRRASG